MKRALIALVVAANLAVVDAVVKEFAAARLKGAAADFVGTGVPQLLAVAVVAVSYKLRHSTFLSILLGTGAYMALIQLL